MAKKSCKEGEYYCNDDKKCKPIPDGYKVREDGYLVKEDLRKWFGKGGKGGVGGGGWDRYNTKGERIGKCAREPGEPKPKCLSKEKAAKMSKDEIAAAVRRKRSADPVADRPGKGGKPVMVSNKIKESKEEQRYCPLCNKMEGRSECSFGGDLWDTLAVKSVEEAKKPEPDHEQSMIRSELATIKNAVHRLQKKMKGEGNVEAWVQSKITKAADYIDAAADYIDSGEHNVHNSMDEAKGDPCWDGYKQVGMKKKGGKMVPNCVKESDLSISEKILLEMEAEVLNEKNVPTNPKLWAKWKSKAKAKFDVYPCVPLESQAITKDGLKTYDELEVGENILTYNIDKDSLEWKPILHLHFYEQAPLKKIYKKTGFSIRATENHKWVVKTGDEYQNVSLVETKDIHKRMRMITCASLKEEAKSSLIEEKWSKNDNWVKKVLSWSNEQREIYLASSIVYDGHDQGGSTKIKDRHTFGFTQKNNDHFWATLLSAYLNGYHVSFYEKTDSISGATIIRNKKYHSTQNLIIEDDGVEDVWCPTTENNTWVMIQNGFITITGNSAYANGWAAKGYKSEGGGWKTQKEEIEIQDAYGNTFAVIDDIIKPEPISDNEIENDIIIIDDVGITEAVRIPAKSGNVIMVVVNWRGKSFSTKMFFPQTSMPKRKDIETEVQKIYPDSRVVYFGLSTVGQGEPLIQVTNEDWQKVNKSDKTDGMSQKAVNAYRRENPGSKLKTAVTEKDPGPGRGKRRKSFCARSKGQQDMHNIDCSKDPDKAICKARRRWRC
jgi:hypothetical protein